MTLTNPYTVPTSTAPGASPLARALQAATTSKALWTFVALGAVLRLVEFFGAGSLQHDEARLSLYITRFSARELLGPLIDLPGAPVQGAPLGYLLLVKALVTLAGAGEAILRLVPLLAALAALPLFLGVMRRVLAPGACALAVLLFALSSKATYYAAEAKPYSSDVFAALALLLAVLVLGPRLRRPACLAALALIGAAAIALSHPALFVAVGAGLVLLFEALAQRDRRQAARVLLVGACWLAAFGALWLVNLRELGGNPRMLRWWADAFMPLPPASLADLRWFGGRLLAVGEHPIHLPLTWLSAALLVAGAVAMARRAPRAFGLLALPIFFALVASGLKKYPFDDRMLTFLLPALLACLAEGAMVTAPRAGSAGPASTSRALLAAGLVAALAGQALFRAGERALVRAHGGRLASVMAEVAERRQPDDRLCAYATAQAAIRFYADRHAIPDASITPLGPPKRAERTAAELEECCRPGRAWLVFAFVGRTGGDRDDDRLLALALERGRRLESIVEDDASAHLIEFP